MKILLIFIIDIYRKYLSFDHGLLFFLAPGGACKQDPSCSLYTRQMVVKYGVAKGIILGLRRIVSCR